MCELLRLPLNRPSAVVYRTHVQNVHNDFFVWLFQIWNEKPFSVEYIIVSASSQISNHTVDLLYQVAETSRSRENLLFLKELRKQLNLHDLNHVKIVAADLISEYSWNVADHMAKNSQLNNSIDIIG